VSVGKTKMFFSKNMSLTLAKSISHSNGFAITEDLKKYLGFFSCTDGLISKSTITLLRTCIRSWLVRNQII